MRDRTHDLSAHAHRFVGNVTAFIRPHAKAMHAVLSDQQLRSAAHEEPYRYVYFNHMNCALKSSLKPKGAAALPRDMQSALVDVQVRARVCVCAFARAGMCACAGV